MDHNWRTIVSEERGPILYVCADEGCGAQKLPTDEDRRAYFSAEQRQLGIIPS